MKTKLTEHEFKSDHHIHTFRCGHADLSMNVFNIIKEAEKKHLHSIAILDHVGSKHEEERIFEIRGEVDDIRTDIEVLVSAECDAIDPVGLSSKIVCSNKLRKVTDFIFCSIHYMPKTGHPWYPVTSIANKEEIKEAWKIWVINLFNKVGLTRLAEPAESKYPPNTGEPDLMSFLAERNFLLFLLFLRDFNFFLYLILDLKYFCIFIINFIINDLPKK